MADKEKIKAKVFSPKGETRHLSAQDFAKMSSDERKALREAIEEKGLDYDEYEAKMKALSPKVVTLKPLTWRTR